MLKISACLRFVCMMVMLLCLSILTCSAQIPSTATKLDQHQVATIRTHISTVWDLLTRSMTDCKTVADPKLAAASVLYFPANFPVPPAIEKLQQDCHVQVKHLSAQIHGPGEVDTAKFEPHGLLISRTNTLFPVALSMKCMAGTVTSSSVDW